MQSFPIPRQRGVAVHAALMAVLAVVSLAAFVFLLRVELGISFALLLLLFLLTAIPLPFLGYRIYALMRSEYAFDREVLRLTWGLRVEEIPISDVEWVRPVQGLIIPVSLPWPPLPGGLTGAVRHPDIGVVEFMASDAEKLLFVATAKRVYAISPDDPVEFMRAFQLAIEMGSLHGAAPHSEFPSFVVSQAWDSPLVRYLWLAGALLNIGLFIWVTVLIPGLSRVSMGFPPPERHSNPSPAHN